MCVKSSSTITNKNNYIKISSFYTHIIFWMFCKYFNSLDEIPTTLDELCSKSVNALDAFTNIKKKYIVKDISDTIGRKFIRIVKYDQNGLLGTNIGATSSPVGSMDIEIHRNEKIIKINYHFIKNKLFCKTHNNIYGNPIDDDEEYLVRKILFSIAKNIAIVNGCKKMRYDTDPDLILYNNHELKKLGFSLTRKIAEYPKNWIITEKIVRNQTRKNNIR